MVRRKFLLNCFLDEGSNITCVDEDVVEERGKELIAVNEMNEN